MSIPPQNTISSVEEQLLKPLSHYGPVTSLKVFQNYVLAGYGPILKVFEVVNNETQLISSQQLFKRNKIHHICISQSGDKVCISGSRSFRVLSLVDTLNNTPSLEEKAINEWITCCEFLDDNTLLILNSHNTVYTVDVSSKASQFILSDKVHCNEKSILYSGSIRLLDDGRVLIAAGTVMNGVIIWDYLTKRIIYNFTEHEGSIFGVQIDSTGKFMISCSDDRSVKLYDLQNGKILANGWGHGSRIWNLRFFKDQSNGLRIMSTGEDCTIRLWRYEPGHDLIQVELLENAHLGKHIWSGDIDDEHLKLFVSGGADGKVRVHDLIGRNNVQEFSLETISAKIGKEFHTKENIKQYSELPHLNLLIIITSHGSIIQYNQLSNEFTLLELTPEESAKFYDFSIMKSLCEINVILIACRNGDILQLRFEGNATQPQRSWIEESQLGNSKLTNLLVASSNSSHYSLTDCPNTKVPFILRKYSDSGVETSFLQQPQQTSFTTTDMTIDSTNSWLILGSRYVSLAIYDISNESDQVTIFKKLSQGDTITSVSIVRSQKNLLTVLLTVRDGVYLYVNISKIDGEFQYEIIHENKLSRGFIEGGFVQNNQLILYGFKSSYFYLWNESKQIEIYNEICGGAHRQWEFFRQDFNSKFIYINKSTLCIKTFNARFVKDFGVINPGTHGREIRSVCISPEAKNGSRLILTASEDTTVKLGKLHSNGSVESYWSLNHHVSGMQTIKFFNQTYAASSAANEEFFIWKFSELDAIPIVIEYSRLKPSADIPDLRIMDFDAFEYENGFIITTVYSDSTIKVWYFDISEKRFFLIIEDRYTTCCILNVNFLFLNNRVLLQIGATDGHLSIWDITNKVATGGEVKSLDEMIIKQQLHQNGIKAILPVKQAGSYEIITGGDDNALILSTLAFDQEKLKLEVKSFIEKAASSTITSISSSGDAKFLVTSVDQIVRCWSYKNYELSCESARYTTIADTGCSDSVIDDGQVILAIGGAGLSTWKLA
ncbi:WD40 repeat-like protein [Suhomyces tanzawaensis NRRL Y-17324]|uniref:WD40 repeat-like protein n=1 Tax=Suhomyces tanzawaensis NRRL Y-17324 TaxID=984487 RepID=A0A1E4SR32_9ASCO|nr:WD40 repeat-like protein [Suhomyces tanzawaensis NRRL Y-17324]ODV81973.1 WD40 repeat-like protein [Suhomyces tanzawaensis NRRL Y-17324]